ncbi:MAG: hypothetical protein ACRDZX_02000 [Acidimicrobiales bacterium]
MGPAELTAVLLVTAACGGAAGWWAGGSPLLERWVLAAEATSWTDGYLATRRAGPGWARARAARGRWARLDRGTPGARARRPGWAIASAAAASALAGALVASAHRQAGELALVPLAGWASAVVVLGLVDAERLVLPTPLVRAAALVTCGALLVAGGATGNWGLLARAGAAAGAAGAVYGAWSLARPRNLGFGDVRMACLVGGGVAALSPPVSAVALACAPLAAAIFGRFGARNGGTGPAGRRPVPLGPFLAFAGVMGAISSAF